MIESEDQKVKRVSEKISKILKEEGMIFDVQTVSQMRLVILPNKEEKKDDPTTNPALKS